MPPDGIFVIISSGARKSSSIVSQARIPCSGALGVEKLPGFSAKTAFPRRLALFFPETCAIMTVCLGCARRKEVLV